jgi:hypothetical protein
MALNEGQVVVFFGQVYVLAMSKLLHRRIHTKEMLIINLLLYNKKRKKMTQ